MEQVRPKYFYEGDFTPYESIFRRYPHKEITCRKNETLSQVGDYFGCHYYILSGALTTFYTHCSGNEKQMFIHGPGIVWPLYFSQNFEQECNLRITAIAPTRCLAISNTVFCTLMEENPQLFPVMANLSRKTMDFLLSDCCNQCFSCGIEKLCNCLYSLCLDLPDSARQEGCYCIPITQTALMKTIGLNKTNTRKYLKLLQDTGAVEVKRGHILVRDFTGLCNFCSPEILNVSP